MCWSNAEVLLTACRVECFAFVCSHARHRVVVASTQLGATMSPPPGCGADGDFGGVKGRRNGLLGWTSRCRYDDLSIANIQSLNNS
jgi:hypothetical protein